MQPSPNRIEPRGGRPWLLLLACILLVFSGCRSQDESEELDGVSETEREYYSSAQMSLRSHNYADAISKLQRLESQYPFGRFAEQAQLELIYAFYKSNQPEAARSAADRFIRLHPQHPNVDYAYYLKGMASFDEDANFLDRFLPIDPAKRDPGAARESFNDFAQLISRFPESKYAPDAQKRMIHLRNLLARYEIHVAKYYIYRGAFIAAANRGRYVVENFQHTPAVADGLAIMVECYRELGMSDLAQNSLDVLRHNYPEHPSLDEDGNFIEVQGKHRTGQSWLNILTFGLFG